VWTGAGLWLIKGDLHRSKKATFLEDWQFERQPENTLLNLNIAEDLG
jgi:hypothetical protein